MGIYYLGFPSLCGSDSAVVLIDEAADLWCFCSVGGDGAGSKDGTGVGLGF